MQAKATMFYIFSLTKGFVVKKGFRVWRHNKIDCGESLALAPQLLQNNQPHKVSHELEETPDPPSAVHSEVTSPKSAC